MNYQDLRTLTLNSKQEEEAVTVNTRALIDKVLARYSSENTTLRELIQNAADANAQSVEVRYETIPGSDPPQLRSDGEDSSLIRLVKSKVKRLIVKNDGQVFGEDDWQRLKRIAEGNPDETKIGAFGVGFYSVFADTDEPFISSGNQTMAFYWKQNSLFTRRAKMDKKDPYTTFLLDYREPGDLPDLKVLCQFFATSLTFVNLSSISLYIDDKKLLMLTKKVSPPEPLAISPSIIPDSMEKMMKISAVETSRVQLDAKYVNITHYKAPVESATGFVKSFFSRVITPQAAPKNAITSANVGQSTMASIFFRVAKATVVTKVSQKFAQELERATKKPPPKKTMLSCLTMSKNEQDASEHESEIFENVIPSKAGKIFIGFPTHQTTAIKAHISAHSVIPTVERENIDLNARIIKTWNVEMLRTAGILVRIMYIDEMSFLEKQANGLKSTDLVKLYDDALHIMRQFTFGHSTPSHAVGAYIAEAFWSCTRYTTMELLSTKGVLMSSKVRLTSDVDFLEGLPILPEALVKGAPEFVGHLKNGGYLSDITITDIQHELSEKPLNEKQTSSFLKWLAKKILSGETDDLQLQMLLSAAVVMASKTQDGKPIGEPSPIPLNIIKYYLNPVKISAELPLPGVCLPYSVTKSLLNTELDALRWKELGVYEWITFIINSAPRLPVEQNLTQSPKFANQALGVVSKNWEQMLPAMKNEIVSLLKDKACIPTRAGMRVPREAYFPTVKLFPDLPIAHGISNVKEKVLIALGVRKTVDLKIVFDRLMGDQILEGKWSHVELIKYLTGVRDDIPAEDTRKLQNTAICKAEPVDSTKLYKVSELYIPEPNLRRLGLPIIYWPGEWKDQSNEAQFLLKLGLKRYPTEETLVKLAVDRDRDQASRERALMYYLHNYEENRYSHNQVALSPAAFLPVEGKKERLARPIECYSDPKVALLGFQVLRKDFQQYSKFFGVKNHPPMKLCAQRLTQIPPQDKTKAIELFEYFAGRIAEISAPQAHSLGQTPLVPVKTATAAKLIHPQNCYIGQQNHKFAAIFDFVDFGTLANAFLMKCGAKQEPTPAEIAYRLARNPTTMYDVFQDNDKYLGVLRVIAEDWDNLRNDNELVRLMEKSPCLGAYRHITTKEDASLLDGLIEEAAGTIKTFELARADQIFTQDEISTFNMFKTEILVAPEEELLETFYINLGSKPLTTSIENDFQFGRTMKDDVPAWRKQIIERARLFLHNNNELKRWDARWLEKNLLVRECMYIKHRRTLKTLNGRNFSRIQDKTAALTAPVILGVKQHVLCITSKPLTYDIAEALVKLILRKPKSHSSLLLDSLLSTDLITLQNRGYNVDRILKARQTEARKIEQDRLKQVEEQQREAEKQEKLYQQQMEQKQQQIQNTAIENKQRMPGGFVDSPDPKPHAQPPIMDTGSFLARNFNKFTKRLGDQNAAETKRPKQLEAAAMPQTPIQKPPVISGEMEKPTEPHRLATNLQRAIQSGRRHDTNSLFSPPTTFEVKEMTSFCDSRPGQDIVYVAEMPNGMKVYMARALSDQARADFLKGNSTGLATFSALLKELADVFIMDHRILNVYYDHQGSTIAFNLNGSLFCNIRFFLQLHAMANQKGWNHEGVKYWFVTICHELAHNLVKEHGSDHSFYTESFTAEYFDNVIPMVQRAHNVEPTSNEGKAVVIR